MKGNEAIAESAIRSGCRFFFGYPITPQNQIPEYMSKRMPQIGGTFLQAESEVSAINMVYGASGSGARVMTSSSGPGISLKQEGISYLAGAQLPCVIVNIMRGGPGLGSIQPSQGDYFQSTRGGGHGDYRVPVLAPSSVSEAVSLTQRAFDLADQYRTPVILLGDGMIGQMMEPVDLPDQPDQPAAPSAPSKPWAATGWDGSRPRSIINSLYIDPSALERHNTMLQDKFAEIAKNEVAYSSEHTDDADLIIIAYGTVARIARSAIRAARASGIKVGMIRPITLWPFPSEPIARAARTAKAFLTVEMSAGQMVDDARLAVGGLKPVYFYGRTGGMVPAVRDVLARIKEAV
jgi:2-oxoglutarate ferredoxin oxidoreductase subunit alpha